MPGGAAREQLWSGIEGDGQGCGIRTRLALGRDIQLEIDRLCILTGTKASFGGDNFTWIVEGVTKAAADLNWSVRRVHRLAADQCRVVGRSNEEIGRWNIESARRSAAIEKVRRRYQHIP